MQGTFFPKGIHTSDLFFEGYSCKVLFFSKVIHASYIFPKVFHNFSFYPKRLFSSSAFQLQWVLPNNYLKCLSNISQISLEYLSNIGCKQGVTARVHMPVAIVQVSMPNLFDLLWNFTSLEQPVELSTSTF